MKNDLIYISTFDTKTEQKYLKLKVLFWPVQCEAGSTCWLFGLFSIDDQLVVQGQQLQYMFQGTYFHCSWI